MLKLITKSRINYLKYLYRNYKNIPSIISFRVLKTPLTTLKLRNNLTIYGDKNSNILTVTDEIFFDEVYLKEKHLKIKQGDIVLDIGGHVGIFTMYALKKGAKKVYTFEPTISNIEIVKKNLKTNNLENAIVSHSAVADKKGKVKLYMYSEDSGNTLSKIGYDGPLSKYITAPSTTLKDIIIENNLKKIDFVKIDCEGSEGLIVKSTPPAIWKKVRQVSMEFHDTLSILNHEELVAKFKKMGFSTKLVYNKTSPIGYIYAWRH